MYSIKKYLLDKKTNEKCLIISESKDFYLVKNEDGSVEGKFKWELEEYNFFKYIIRRFKKCKN